MNKNSHEMDIGCTLLAMALGVFLIPWLRGAEQAGATDQATPARANKSKLAWKRLDDGKSLAGWKEAKFGGEGEVYLEGGAIVMSQGNDMTAITYARDDFPSINYEVAFDGQRLKGNDFFCTTTFPVGNDPCSLVIGGWGGAVVGLSNIDDKDASENETSSFKTFKKNQWYHVRIRVTKDRIAAWIDDKQVVDLATKGHRISIRPECDLCKPFGIATWRTVGAVRDIRVRALGADETKTRR